MSISWWRRLGDRLLGIGCSVVSNRGKTARNQRKHRSQTVRLHLECLEDRLTPSTRAVSITPYVSAPNGTSTTPVLSYNGRFVAFASTATNMTTSASNGVQQIFLRDLQTGITKVVSTSSAGVLGNSTSMEPSVSADGRYVAFASMATNLISAGTSAKEIFVHDMQTGTTRLVSQYSSGTAFLGTSAAPSISGDGRFIAFQSNTTQPSLGANGFQVYLFDQSTGVAGMISVNANGTAGNLGSQSASISNDGNYVAFGSFAGNFGSNTFGNEQIYVYSRQTGSLTLVSTDGGGNAGYGWSWTPSISGNGSRVVFVSNAYNLVSGAAGYYLNQVFVHDLSTGVTALVSSSNSATPGNASSLTPRISGDGTVVTFASFATNLVTGSVTVEQVYSKDLNTGITSLISMDNTGAPGNSASDAPAINYNGQEVVFASQANNFAGNVSSSFTNIFLNAPDLVVTTQPPATITAGSSFNLVVKVQDILGNTDTRFNGKVTVALNNNPGGGTLGGTVTVSAVQGVATFSGLSVNKAGTGYTLKILSEGLNIPTTNSFDVVPGTATQLTITTQPPTSVAAGGIFSVTLAATDAYGNVNPAFSGNVTLKLAANPAGGSLGGTLTVPAVNGVATFTDLSLLKAGTGYTLQAVSTGLKSVTTTAIKAIAGAATQLVVTTQPAYTVTPGSFFGFVITAEDFLGNVDPNFTGIVTVTLADNPANGTLAGTVTATAKKGIAVFSGLSLDNIGSYTLQAAADSLTSAITNTVFVDNPPTLTLEPSTPFVDNALSFLHGQDPLPTVLLQGSDSDTGNTFSYSVKVFQDNSAYRAYTLNQDHHFVSAGTNYLFNRLGTNEKFLRDSAGKAFFIQPSGKLFLWTGSLARSPLVATLDKSFWTNPTLFWTTPAPTDVSGTYVSLGGTAGDTLSFTSAIRNFKGTLHIVPGVSDGIVTTTQNFSVTVTNTAPTLAGIDNLTFSHGLSPLPSVTFTGADADNDPLTYTASVFVDSAAYEAYQLKTTYNLFNQSSTYNYNLLGLKEKWLQGDNKQWYAILPNGEVHVRTGSTIAKAVLATLDSSYYKNPGLVLTAQPPTPLADYATVTDNVLTFTGQVSGYVGKLAIQVSATDGVDTARQTFRVTVTNAAPTLDPITDISFPHDTATPPTVTFTAADPDNDALTYSTRVFVDNAAYEAYQLKTTYGLYTRSSTYYYNTHGQKEKWLQGYNKQWFAILPNGEVHLWTGTIISPTILTTLNSSYYANPGLVLKATAPTPVSDYTTLSGNVLSFTSQIANYTGTLAVEVTVTDPFGASASRTFKVVVS